MGQCVLRDMGFDFEKDPVKKQMLDNYLKEKLSVRYPEARNFPKVKKIGSVDDGLTATKYGTPAEDSSGIRITFENQGINKWLDMDGRLSRPMRKAKFKEMMIQTETTGESFRNSRIRSYENRPPNSANFPGHKSELSLFNHQRSKTDVVEAQKTGHSRVSSQTEGLYDLSNGRFPSSSNKNTYMSPENSGMTPTRASRIKSDNGRTSSLRRSMSPQPNMFKGIESIDFKDASKSPQNFATGRSKTIVLKGFQNKYFHNYKDQTPSPHPEENRVFDDDDEEDFPYDDY